MIFSYTELLFPRHSKSDRTLISFRMSRSELLEKSFLEIIRKDNIENSTYEDNIVASGLSNISGRKFLR